MICNRCGSPCRRFRSLCWRGRVLHLCRRCYSRLSSPSRCRK